MSDDIPCVLKEAVVGEHEQDEIYELGAEIGGVYQKILVTEDWYESKVNP